jgi:hypothetical protein
MARISFTSLLTLLFVTVLAGCTNRNAPVGTSQQSEEQMRAETERAFAQEREADVVVFYDTARDLTVQRPEPEQRFASEDALLTHLTERQAPKRLLVVILSKRHEWSDPKQTLDGFWQACRRTGFERVIIQQGAGFGRPILHE